MKNIRYYHCPQMKIYDSIGYQWIQNLMFMNSPNFRSEVCNTDIYGLRFNSKLKFNPGNSIFSQVTDEDKSVMIGSSTTFGVGSTLDKNTIPSILSEKSKYFFYNLGGRAFNGFQEIILFQLFTEKMKGLKKIILYSGMNDLYMSYNKSFISQFPGPFYFNKEFLRKMNDTNLSFKRKILKLLLPNLNIDYRNIKINELIDIFFKKKSKEIEEKKFPDIKLEDIVDRNIYIWSLLSKSSNSEVIFFLPPFIDWCKSKTDYSNEEKEIAEYIEKNQAFKTVHHFDKISSQYNMIKSLFKNCCEKYEIKFYDCNEIFKQKENVKKWLFVDKTHLTDFGNNQVSNYIITKI